MNKQLTTLEQDGIADIIDGTIDTMLQDVEFDHEDVAFWIAILRKFDESERAQTYLKAWVAEAAKEGVTL